MLGSNQVKMNLFLWCFVLVVLLFFCEVDSSTPCTFHMSVDITDGDRLPNGGLLHDSIVYPPGFHFEYDDGNETSTRGCICLLKPCMRKCCPLDEAFVGRACGPSNTSLIRPFNPPIFSMELKLPLRSDAHFALIYGNPCNGHRFSLKPDDSEQSKDAFFLQPSGELYLPRFGNEPSNSSLMSYCMDAFTSDPEEEEEEWTDKYLPLLCFVAEPTNDESDLIYAIFPIGMLISIPFLVATFLVYAIIPELRNLHGKALMSYVFGLIIAYTFLSIVQISGRFETATIVSNEACLFIAFSIYFFFMVSFFWLNVMCFDIWLTFSGFRAPRMGGRRNAEKRRFIMYCFYAWGFPLLLTSICALMQFHANIPTHHIRPQFAETKCWFMERNGELLYFYGPVIILVVVNLLLFGSTTYRIIQINRETAMLKTGDSARHDQYNKDKQRFNLYLKLFLVMGVNWVAEWVSFMLGGSKYLWILTDFSNTILGCFIFFIFVWKKKVKNLLIKRYHVFRYGQSSTKDRSSSRYRSTNMQSMSNNETDKSFLSQTEDPNAIKMRDMT